MRLLIADKLHPRAIEELRALPVEVDYEPTLTKETLPTRLDGVGILVVRSTQVTADAIAAAKQLNLIVRAGAEHHTIDVKAASQRGIYVANCPGKNGAAVAELVLGMLVSLDRRIPDAVSQTARGQWGRAEFSKAQGLYGRTLGIAGFGAIGREVAVRAKGFGMHVVAFSRTLSPAKAAEFGVGYASNLEELARKVSALTVHLALTEKTKKMVGERVFSALPEGALFVNAARADLVDYGALQKAVETRGLRAAVDVYPEEPREDGPFGAHVPKPNTGIFYGTPHIASATDQAQFAVASETVRVVRAFLHEGTVPNVVNVWSTTTARFQLVIRMVDKVGTFANVLAVLKRHGINVEEVTNTVFEGGVAACAKLRLVSRPSEACLTEVRAFEEVLHVDLVPLPMFA